MSLPWLLVIVLLVVLLLQSRISERRRRQRQDLRVKLRLCKDERHWQHLEIERLRAEQSSAQSGFVHLPRPQAPEREQRRPALSSRVDDMVRLANDDTLSYGSPLDE